LRSVAAPHTLARHIQIGDFMKTRFTVLTFALCALAFTVSFAQNASMGTWKLNEVRSQIPAGVGKNTTVVYSASGADIKVTTDGVDATGKPAHTEWTGKFDAKPYPVTGDPNVNYRAYKAKGDRTLLPANMMGDKTVSNGKIQIAKDGKSRTLDMNYFSWEGTKKKKTHAKYVYEKQ
jgi:hypothetical protein